MDIVHPAVERYLEAAKLVADHAVIGAGPLGFYTDPGKTGLELSALNRIENLYQAHGFRVVSGEAVPVLEGPTSEAQPAPLSEP